jgi:hypothetical protein
MKKIIFVGLGILAISTSAALAKKAKPAAAAPAAAASPMGPVMPKGSAADLAMYKKNLHDSGMKK